MKLDTFKLVAGLVVGSGVGKITSTIINNNVIPQTNFQKVLITAGKFGIGIAAGAIVCNHVDNYIDDTVGMYNTIKPLIAAKK